MTELERITVHSERMNAPHNAHPLEIIGWLNGICSCHEPTETLPEPRAKIDEYGILVTWTTKHD